MRKASGGSFDPGVMLGDARGVPLATAGVVGLCCGVHLLVFLFDPPLGDLTLVAAHVLVAHEWWRVWTAAFLHGGVMHLAMNMLSTVTIAGSLERQVGSLPLLFTVLWQTIASGAAHVIASWCLSVLVLGDLSYLTQPSVGFSGVLFALVVLEIRQSNQATRTLFGAVLVPARAYPWLLLVALQVMIPRVSFLGHLSGIAVGTVQASGGLACLLPSPASVRAIEQWPLLRRVTGHRLFVPCPDHGTAATGGGEGAVWRDLIQEVLSVLRMFAEFLWVCVSAALQGIAGVAQAGSNRTADAQEPTLDL